MASPVGNPNSSSFLFKPPSPSPNPTPLGGATPPPQSFPPPPSFPAPPPSYTTPPPVGAFSYPPTTPQFPHHHHPFLHYPQEPLHRPTIPYPAAAPSNLLSHTPNTNSNASAGASPGARLMALLNPPAQLESAVSMPQPSSLPSEISAPPNAVMLHPIQSAPPVALSQPTPARVPSSKLPRGRLLGTGERAVYDVDSRLPGESQPPQLEVTPITKYNSDPGLVLGRQIAVNRTYICYGLKLGAIRVLNINTALRALLKGHSQRVTDMAFFADDVHLLASACVDGRVFVWKIDEGPDEENKPQIKGKILVAIHIVGNGDHPRICWHSHKQEILFIGIKNCVLRIDTTKVGRGKEFSAEEPLKCPLEKLIEGVQLIGKHDGDLTDLSISQWMTTRLASASKDGTVTIWDERRLVSLATFRPHDGYPVDSVEFMTSPYQPDHINLITAGPLNREIKIWASTSEDGWLLPGDSESWQCIQSLDLRSSLESRLEEAFFNQIVVLPQASLILIANAKKNAIYTVHVDYGPYPSSTHLDYIADFTVAMPILSLTGTSDLPLDGEQVVQVYCVQTQAIQQYALDLTQCLPPPMANSGVGRDPVSHALEIPSLEGSGLLVTTCGSSVGDFPLGSASPKSQCTDSSLVGVSAASYPVTSVSFEDTNIHELSMPTIEVKPSALLPSADSNSLPLSSSPPLALDLTGKSPAQRSTPKISEQGPSAGDRDIDPSVFDYLADRGMDAVVTSAPDVSVNEVAGKDEPKAGQDLSMVPNPRLMFKLSGNSTHLITPSEILSGTLSSSENNHVNQGPISQEVKAQDMVLNSVENLELEVKVVGQSKPGKQEEFESQRGSQTFVVENKETTSQSSETNFEMGNECSIIETASVEKTGPGGDIFIAKSIEQTPSTIEEEFKDDMKDLPEKLTECAAIAASESLSAAKGKKQNPKHCQTSGPSSHSSSPFNSIDSLHEPGSIASAPSTESAFPQILALQDMVNQLISMQKEMQRQMSVIVSTPVTKESKRVETALGRSMEKVAKANVDALWARFQEENAKHEKMEKERMQQITSLITDCMNKDLPAMLERVIKKEISSVGTTVARAISPIISSAIVESFQKGVGDKAVSQLEKSVSSKLDTTIARQIQTQFQTSGKQALQDALKFCLESSVIPSFEKSCKTMFEQIDNTFQKGMSEHTVATQQQFEAAHSPLALTLRDVINSTSSIAQNLTSELLDSQHKLLALVAAGNANALTPIALQQTNGSMHRLPDMVEAPLDPTKELTRLISECKYEEAFTMALQRSDVALVSWLCTQVDLRAICSTEPLALSQGVLLALLQQLACDISNETSKKVSWMTDVAVAINPADPLISLHVRPIFEQVYSLLAHQRSIPTTSPPEAANIRLVMHVINSVLMSCK